MGTVSANYLDKVRFAVRRSTGNTLVDAELTDIIQQCRADLIRMGLNSAIAEDESNPLVLGALRCFARWQFGIDGDNAERNREDYYALAEDLRKSQIRAVT